MAQNVDVAKSGVVTLTFSTDTNPYGSGELIADTQELAGCARIVGGCVGLQNVTLIDKADQGVELWLVFLNANQSLGTENSAPTISDANAEKIIGHVKIESGDYVDIGGAKVVSKSVGKIMQAVSGTTSLWVAIVNSTGTPTYGAADLIGQFAFMKE